MRTLNLDASEWTDITVFYDALLYALDAPFWHGRNINALIDSMIWGDINGIEPPYRICIRNLAKASADARDEIEALISHIPTQKAEHLRLHGNAPEVFLEIQS